MVFCADDVGDAVEALVVASCEDDKDERAEVERKVEDGEVVVVEGERNGMMMAGLEAAEGLDVGVGAATEE